MKIGSRSFVLPIIALGLAMGAVSCQKRPSVKVQTHQALTHQQQVLAHRFDQITDIIRKIYRDPKVREEVSLAIFSNYYVDEVVKLKDLLHPDKSPLFQTAKLTKSLEAHQIDKNLFASRFFDVLEKGNYPGLRQFLDSACAYNDSYNQASRATSSYRVAPIDPEAGGGGSTGGTDVTIYYPYSENFVNEPNAPLSTLTAHGELDGDYGTDPNGNTVWIDDDYAEIHPTQIIGMNGGDYTSEDGNPGTPVQPANPQDTIFEVFVGFVKCKKQYDRFISLSGNGGASEIHICRGSAYLALDSTGHVPHGTFDEVEIEFRRKEIKKCRKYIDYFKKVFAIWDPNWKWQNREQVFAIYEEDTDPQVNLQMGLNTTLKIAGQEITIGPFEFHYSAKTKDEIIRNLKRQHEEFFVNNKLDQGFGFLADGSTSGLHGPWPIIDGGADVSYTMPEQVTTY